MPCKLRGVMQLAVAGIDGETILLLSSNGHRLTLVGAASGNRHTLPVIIAKLY